ncbi:5'-nucleotidase, lipoprotein e(P4) family [Myxococcota bacterium]
MSQQKAILLHVGLKELLLASESENPVRHEYHRHANGQCQHQLDNQLHARTTPNRRNLFQTNGLQAVRQPAAQWSQNATLSIMIRAKCHAAPWSILAYGNHWCFVEFYVGWVGLIRATTVSTMRKTQQLRCPPGWGWSALLAVLALLVLIGGCAHRAVGQRKQYTSPAEATALLWMRTSAEYGAICMQTFDAAWQRISSADSHEQGKPPAVVMDLDETVLDSLAFQYLHARSGEPWDESKWLKWNTEHSDLISLVPGAKSFVDKLRNRGIHVAYVSNRDQSLKAPTLRVLARLGIASSENDIDLQLRADTGSKADRRGKILEEFEVLAYLGDNLADLSEIFDKTETTSHQDRFQQLCANRQRLGKTWFVLPNPIFGAWKTPFDQEREYLTGARILACDQSYRL